MSNLLTIKKYLVIFPVVGALACGDNNTDEVVSDPEPTVDAPFVPESDQQAPVSASFAVSVDRAHAALQTTQRQPQDGPVTVSEPASDIAVVGRAKTISLRPELLWIDLLFVNNSATSMRDLRATITPGDSSITLIDLSTDPLAEQPLQGDVLIGGLAAEGVAQISIGVPSGDTALSFDIAIAGTTTLRSVNSSAPVAITPDGQEAWIVFPDGDVVAVIDTATDQRVAQIDVPESPRSVALTSDGQLALVASANSNTVAVIDRQTRAVIHTLTEQDGIGREPRHIVTSSDGARAYVSAYVGDSVTALERMESGKFRVMETVDVGRRPTGMSLTADGQTLLVTHFLPRGPLNDNETWVSIIDTDELRVTHEAIDRDAANLAESQCLADLFGAPAQAFVFEGVSTQLSGMFIEPNGNMGWVPAIRSVPVPVWEVEPGTFIPGINPSLFAPHFTLYFDTRDASATEIKRHPQVIDFPDGNLDYLRCAGVTYETEASTRQLPQESPDTQFNAGAATPTGTTSLTETGLSRFIAFSRGGRRAFVISYLADEISVYDAVTQHAATQRHFTLSGSNPTGMAITPDGSKAYVSYDNSTFASVLSMGSMADPTALPVASYVPFEYTSDQPNIGSLFTRMSLRRFIGDIPDRPDLTEIGQVPLVDSDPMDPQLRRGRILFTSSNPDKYPELSRSRQASCQGCHPDGGHDGIGWGSVEGERRTLSLRGGVAGRGWLHQSGTHRDAMEFVRTVVPDRLGGTGLSDDDYEALAQYLAFGIPRLQSPAVDQALADEGAAIFEAKCAGCHAGEAFSGGNPDPMNPYIGGAETGPQLHDIGTASDDMQIILPAAFSAMFPPPSDQLYDLIRGDRALGAGDPVQQILGFSQRPDRARGEIRPTSLVNAWDHALFFHDGRFTTLEEVVAYLDQALGLDMTSDDQRAVIEYLKTL